MIVHEGYENINILDPVVTLGIFDGVHRGHMTLLNILVTRARELKGESVVITFFPHPRLVLEKDHLNLSFLTTMEEKKALLETANIDHLIVLEFNLEFSRIKACDFIRTILAEKIGTKHLLIGFNHHFGWEGEGDYRTIMQCSESLDFSVEQVKGFHSEAGTISSSIIRKALLSGRIDEANGYLGYSYSVTGTVVEGRHLGQSLGFPTANIKPDDQYKLIPGNGVYAVEVVIDKTKYIGMMSIGTNPTVNSGSGSRTIEVNILDFQDDIYGKTISVIFRRRLRDEKKFGSLNELAEQMLADRENTIRFLT